MRRRYLLLIALFCCTASPAHAARYKAIARVGYGSFQYTAPFSSGSNASPSIGGGWDISWGGASSVGFDVALGLGLSDKLISFSQFHGVYKYYPFTYATYMLDGDTETKVSLRSRWYPYVGAGLGYSTLVVKAKATSFSTLTITTNSQYFDAALILGTDFMIGERWGINGQLTASYGVGGTATGNLSAMGVLLGFGPVWNF